MKKLSLLFVVLFALASCSKDNGLGCDAEQSTAYVPHFYGAKMLENPAPETRGVATAMKLWRPEMAMNLTFKFINGSAAQQSLVKETIKEWEKVAGVKFTFVDSKIDAIIRVGFNTVPGMMTSWALTGTDHTQVYDKQNEPTINFAWNRASDAVKRSDVLRAFGQALGLELEFRHPNFNPQWFTNANGTINETLIKEYWENELANYISWTDLKTMVLDPISAPSFTIHKTTAYDPKSVMTWPFYEQIANKLPIVNGDSDLNTELSAQDKAFVKMLYGAPLAATKFSPLIEFEYTGTVPQFMVTSTKNLVVRWDATVSDEYTAYDIPVTEPTPYMFLIYNYFGEARTRKVVIGELVPNTLIVPDSYTITRFEFKHATRAQNFKIGTSNKALNYVYIERVPNPIYGPL